MDANTYYPRYRLLKDTPLTKAGAEFFIRWTGAGDFYTTGYEMIETFTRDQVESMPEWFEPLDEPQPFYLQFPENSEKLARFYNFGDVHLTDSDRTCRIIRAVLNSKEYAMREWGLLKELYDAEVARRLNHS